MPMAFDNIAGLAGNALVLARGNHNVTCTGPSAAVAALVPEFQGTPLAAGNGFTIVYYRIVWLILAVIRAGPGFPVNLLICAATVHVHRLGVAYEACVAGGLDLRPCSASVARVRLRRCADALYATNPVPFQALAADVYMMIMPPPAPPPAGGGVVPAVVAAAASIAGASATLAMMLDGDAFLPMSSWHVA